jgi:hypothetical protein
MVDDGVGVLPSVFFELLLEIVRKTANSLLGEWAEQRQRWTSSGLAKLAGGKNKSGDTVEPESRRDLAMATPRKDFSFLYPNGTQRSSQLTEVGTRGAIRQLPHGARYRSAREVSTM